MEHERCGLEVEGGPWSGEGEEQAAVTPTDSDLGSGAVTRTRGCS